MVSIFQDTNKFQFVELNKWGLVTDKTPLFQFKIMADNYVQNGGDGVTKIEEANFERCVNLLADLIMKYADKVLEEIEKEKGKAEQTKF